jgi:hypothetical protein
MIFGAEEIVPMGSPTPARAGLYFVTASTGTDRVTGKSVVLD